MKRDPVTFEVIKNFLTATAEEMEIVLLRSAYSPIIKELLDASSAICDGRGRLVAQAVGIPIHLGGLSKAVQSVIAAFPQQTIRDGDVFLLNDPYSGAMHLPDFVVVTPVFAEGKLTAFTVNLAHQSDVGGMAPGSSPGDATEIFQEGLCIPPLKLFEEGRPNDTLFRLIERNVRSPEILLGDLRAQVSANGTGQKRLREVFGRYGRDAVLWYMDELLDYTERLTRREIATRIADGIYSAEDLIDDDGIVDQPVKVRATVEVRGDEVVVDFTGSSPQVRGAINATAASTESAVMYAMKSFVDPRIPTNDGSFRPLKMKLPLGTVVDAKRPAAVNARAIVARRVCDVVLSCLGQANPGRAVAQSADNPYIVTIGGINRRTGRYFLYFEGISGGMGARSTKDGADAIETHTTNCKNLPMEAGELDYPLRFRRLEIISDSGGAGRYRGGLGIRKEIEILQDAVLGVRADRIKHPAGGMAGGQAGAPGRLALVTREGDSRVLPSKKSLVQVREGDRLVIETPGAGGYGDPAQRDRKESLRDLADGRVSGPGAADQAAE